MFSVTQRIKSVSQPTGGYVPKSLFKIRQYDDLCDVQELNVTLYSIQGMAVDYLTRFILSGDKYKSFEISILGAKELDLAYENHNEYNRIMSMLDNVKGLDYCSIVNACKIVCYDVAKRQGIGLFRKPSEVEFSNDLYSNIRILVNRCISFFEQAGSIVLDGITFEGGYTDLVSTGDADYLTKDMLIDLKVSKSDFSTKWSLQLLMYYILGIHSIHPEFSNIEKLCIFNPYKNISYICNIDVISDEAKYDVSANVLGYNMVYNSPEWNFSIKRWEYDYSTWREVDGSNPYVLKKVFTDSFVKTDFNVEEYEDGIFDITVDDYWTYLSSTFDEYKKSFRPFFKNTKYVKLIKKNGFYMFVSVSPKGTYSLLHGARLHSLNYSLEYYYDYIEKYCASIIMHFSKYWDALREISKQVVSLKPSDSFLRGEYSKYLHQQELVFGKTKKCINFDEWYNRYGYKYRLSGKIHGCIVDIDFFNHIYINPIDGTVTPYHAMSMYDKDVYKNTRSLLAASRPELLTSFDKLISDGSSNLALITQNSNVANSLIASKDNEISLDFVKVYEHDMYVVSNKLKPLQNIYDNKLVQIWYNEILGDNLLLLEDRYKQTKPHRQKVHLDYVGQTELQKNGIKATIIRYGNYRDIDVQFEDGEIVEKTTLQKWKNGNVHHPNIIIEKKHKKTNNKSIKDKYIGMTKKMNCGLMATVIDYKDCKNVTIQFEDGLIKSGIRSDHFVNGKVSHNRRN